MRGGRKHAKAKNQNEVQIVAMDGMFSTAGRPWTMYDVDHERSEDERMLKVVSYNLLADSLVDFTYMPYLDPHIADWEARKTRLLELISELDGDVLCLQEVDRTAYRDFFEPELAEKGYSGIHALRGGDYKDGCALFVRESAATMISCEAVHLKLKDHPTLDRDNVCLVAVLDVAGKKIVLATTHLVFNPKRGDVKLAQLQIVTGEIAAKATEVQACGVILCGDFNLTPDSPLYAFLSQGVLLAPNKIDRRGLSGQVGNRNTMHVQNQRTPSVRHLGAGAFVGTHWNGGHHPNWRHGTTQGMRQGKCPHCHQVEVRARMESYKGKLVCAMDPAPFCPLLVGELEQLHSYVMAQQPTQPKVSDHVEVEDILVEEKVLQVEENVAENVLQVEDGVEENVAVKSDGEDMDCNNDDEFDTKAKEDAQEASSVPLANDEYVLGAASDTEEQEVDCLMGITAELRPTRSAPPVLWTVTEPNQIGGIEVISDRSFALINPLELKSAYAQQPNHTTTGEPAFTSYHADFKGCVDYIWYGGVLGGASAIRCEGILEPPLHRDLSKSVGLPNATNPSDHIPMCALFRIGEPSAAAQVQSSQNDT